MAGNSSGSIVDCYTDGSVFGELGFIGGLAGYNFDGSIAGCYSTAYVSGDGRIAGLVGQNNGSISNCFATGNVRGDDGLGGLVGYNYGGGTITNCYATGDALGDYGVGGLVGSNHADSSIVNCYASGSVVGDKYVGGIAGTNTGGFITNCFSVGKVSLSDHWNSKYEGGFLGYIDGGTYSGCFWDTGVNSELSGVGNSSDPVGVMGRTTAEMRMQSTFTRNGWDFVDEDFNGTDDVWKIREGVTYPQLSWREITGDVVGRWGVDLFDLAELAKYYGEFNNKCDFDESGFVDVVDLMIMAEHWLEQ